MSQNSKAKNTHNKLGHKKLLKLEAKASHRVRRAKPRNLRVVQLAYINSFAAKYSACLELREVNSREMARKLAAKIDLWKPSQHSFTVKAVHKGKPADYEGCHYRFIFSFGVIDKARQAVLKNVLKARGDTLAEQALLRGGRNAAVEQIKRHYREGYTYIAKMDISSCYNSFTNADYIAKALCIPKQVVCSTMMEQSLEHSPLRIHKDTVKDILFGGELGRSSIGGGCEGQFQKNGSANPLTAFKGFFGDDWNNARQGLIQGAKCSGHAAEVLLRPVCEACCLSGNGRVVNYADDFLLMATSLTELLQLVHILESACSSHPAGALKVTKEIIGHQESFDFLGYSLEPTAARKRFKFRWAQKSKDNARYERKRTYAVLNSDADLKTKQRRLDKCVRYHRNSVRNFPAWIGGSKYVEKKLARLKRLLKEAEVRCNGR